MSKRSRKPVGPVKSQGRVQIQQEDHGAGGERTIRKVRITHNVHSQIVIDIDSLFDLAELVDDLCDRIEDGGK